MRYRALTQTGDYSFGRGPQEYLANSPQCVAQAVLTALLLHQGEWFLDVTAGMQWETQVLGLRTGSLRDTAIRNCILGVQGVNKILSYQSVLGQASPKDAGVFSAPSATVSANFAGPNQNPIIAPWQNVGAGFMAGGVIQLLANAASPTSLAAVAAGAVYAARQWNPDQSSQVTLRQFKHNAGYLGVILRGDLIGRNFYYAAYDGLIGGIGLATPVNLHKVQNGVPHFAIAQLGYQLPVVGDSLAVQAQGSTIRAFVNGSFVGQYMDPDPIESGIPGIFLQTIAPASVTDLAISNWVGGAPVPENPTSGLSNPKSIKRNLVVNAVIDTIYGKAVINTSLPGFSGGYGIGPYNQIPYSGA